MNSKSFSQTVILNKKQAKETAKDLIKGDLCQEEKKHLEEQNNILSNQIEQKTQEVENLESQNKKYRSVVEQDNKNLILKDEIIADLEKSAKRKENISVIWKIGTAVGVVLGIILAVQ